MTNEQALELCDHRLKFCGNIYGAKWKQEEPFLKACKEALEKENHFRSLVPGEEMPPENKPVLALVSGIVRKNGADVPVSEETVLAEFDPDKGWKILDRKFKEFEIYNWRFIPEW